jgi:ADP-heptose:LPS heptosyltransferase
MAETGGSIITLGTAAENDACQQVAAAAAPNGMNLAGQTTLEELAGVLALSAGVLCNDSGGMHLAAALGTPLVALFGITHPGQTGPLGRPQPLRHRSDIRARDIPRRSAKAEKALRSIPPTKPSKPSSPSSTKADPLLPSPWILDIPCWTLKPVPGHR